MRRQRLRAAAARRDARQRFGVRQQRFGRSSCVGRVPRTRILRTAKAPTYGTRALLPAPSGTPARLGLRDGWTANANAGRVNSILVVHLWLGFLSWRWRVLFVWQRRGRRITLYVLTLQIALGFVLMVQGCKVPWYHYALAIAGLGRLHGAPTP